MELGILKRSDFKAMVPFKDARVLISFAPSDELNEVRRQATKTAFGTGEKVFDPVEANRIQGKKVVHGWEGFTLNGEEFPFNDENRDLLMARWGEFSDFVWSTCQNLQLLHEAEQRAKAKNS